MARLDWVGILTIAIVAIVPGSGAFAAAPAWESGGKALEVSDLPSVVVSPVPKAITGEPPLPPEPAAAEDIGPLVEAEDGGDERSVAGAAPSLGERLQGFVPSTPDVMNFDSAVAIEPDGTMMPCSTKRSVWDCLDWVGDACWVARFEAIALWRSAPANRPLFTTADQGAQTLGPTVFNASQLQSDPLAAPRLTLARLDECGRGFDASYLYAGNFFSRRSLPTAVDGYAFAAPGIYGNPSGLAGTPISSAQQQLTASLQTAEINYREPLGWGSTRFLTGFRWLQWREDWSMVDQSSVGGESWQTGCLNNLYGGQIGLDSMLWNSGEGMRLEGLVKAGAYYNAANQSSRSSTAAAAVTVDTPASSGFVGEVGLTSVLPLRKNLDLRCGYFGLWLQGLAQPTRQLGGQTLAPAAPPSGTLTTNGGVVLQGVSLGLEGRW